MSKVWVVGEYSQKLVMGVFTSLSNAEEAVKALLQCTGGVGKFRIVEWTLDQVIIAPGIPELIRKGEE